AGPTGRPRHRRAGPARRPGAAGRPARHRPRSSCCRSRSPAGWPARSWRGSPASRRSWTGPARRRAAGSRGAAAHRASGSASASRPETTGGSVELLGGGLLRGGLLGGRLLGRRLLGGGLLDRLLLGHRAAGPAVGQQLAGALVGQRLDVVALAQRGVGLAVG